MMTGRGVVMLAVAGIAACGAPELIEPPRIGPVARVVVTPGAATLAALTDTVRLAARAYDSAGLVVGGRTVTWTSANLSIARVIGGLVTAFSNGTVAITATIDSQRASVDVTVRQAATRVLFANQPTDVMVTAPITPLVRVEVHDSRGREMELPVGSVTVSLGASSPAAGVLSGRLAVDAAGGVALFDNLQVSAAGEGYTLKAEAAGLTATSMPFEVVAFSSVAAGDYHTCAITTSGKAVCWGENNDGQLGDGSTSRYPTPHRIAGGLAFTSLAPAGRHTCAIASGNLGYCWGVNASGQVGDNSRTTRLSPTRVADDGVQFSTVSARFDHSCGLTPAGAAYCWGRNITGELGDGFVIDRLKPVVVGGGLTFVSLTTGSASTCGLTPAGQAYCWGGAGLASPSVLPVEVPGGITFASLISGSGHTCGVTPAHLAHCWGHNGSGTLGDGTQQNRTAPVPVAGSLEFASMAPGNWFTCGLTIGGLAYCWGSNVAGVLGNGSLSSGSTFTPQPVVGGIAFAQLTAGRGHACGRTAVGVLYCWGTNSVGQLGNGGGVNQGSPVPILWRP